MLLVFHISFLKEYHSSYKYAMYSKGRRIRSFRKRDEQRDVDFEGRNKESTRRISDVLIYLSNLWKESRIYNRVSKNSAQKALWQRLVKH